MEDIPGRKLAEFSSFDDMRESFSGASFRRLGIARRELYFFFPFSSAMYMISCLKMKRFGALCRVRRIMFLS